MIAGPPAGRSAFASESSHAAQAEQSRVCSASAGGPHRLRVSGDDLCGCKADVHLSLTRSWLDSDAGGRCKRPRLNTGRLRCVLVTAARAKPGPGFVRAGRAGDAG